MSRSRPFVLQPVATSLLMAAILLGGIVAFTQLPVSTLLPDSPMPHSTTLFFCHHPLKARRTDSNGNRANHQKRLNHIQIP